MSGPASGKGRQSQERVVPKPKHLVSTPWVIERLPVW